tara:strand:- start:31 stop:1170 length:1140 start_codon:yes stop_codon:yes gene_type:complete
MKSKIVHIIIGLNVGGAELMLKRLVESSNNEFEHIIVSLTNEGEIGEGLIEKGFELYFLRLNKMNFIWLGPIRLIWLLKKIKPSIVHTWMYHSDFLGGICAKVLGINNIIWSIRSTEINKGGSKITVLVRKVLSILSYVLPKRIICAANNSRDIHVNVGYDSSKMIVIPNGFTKDKFYACREKCLDLEVDLDLHNKIVLTSIGRYHPIKNHKLFVNACSLLSEKYNEEKFAFLMVGRDVTKENKELNHLISHTHNPSDFILLGERKDVNEILNVSSIYCLHSVSEGFPNVLGEAMCLGKLCVATDVGDARYIALNDDFIVSLEHENDEQKYVEVLSKAVEIAKSKSMLEYISMESVNKMKRDYTMDSIVNQYEELYMSL